MMIFFKERLAYLAVPKTGTSAIQRALAPRASAIFRDPPGMKHTNARGFEKKFRHLFERGNLPPVETVAVMRDPLEWLGSWYRYRQRPALSGHPNSTKDVSLNQFIEAYMRDKQPAFANIGSQAKFLTDDQGELLVNHLFSYQDFKSVKTFLERRLRTKIELRTINKSPERILELDAALETQIRSHCALDFQIYEGLQDGPLSIS